MRIAVLRSAAPGVCGRLWATVNVTALGQPEVFLGLLSRECASQFKSPCPGHKAWAGGHHRSQSCSPSHRTQGVVCDVEGLRVCMKQQRPRAGGRASDPGGTPARTLVVAGRLVLLVTARVITCRRVSVHRAPRFLPTAGRSQFTKCERNIIFSRVECSPY